MPLGKILRIGGFLDGDGRRGDVLEDVLYSGTVRLAETLSAEWGRSWGEGERGSRVRKQQSSKAVPAT